jgi:hypothetical protein
MWQDPIVEEVRRRREEYAAQFNYDLKAICRDLRDKQKKGERSVVSLPPKRVPAEASPKPQPAV